MKILQKQIFSYIFEGVWACIHTRVYARFLHNIEICLYLGFKWLYFAFKISLCRSAYLDTKIGENRRIFDGLKFSVLVA